MFLVIPLYFRNARPAICMVGPRELGRTQLDWSSGQSNPSVSTMQLTRHSTTPVLKSSSCRSRVFSLSSPVTRWWVIPAVLRIWEYSRQSSSVRK